jgi:hypothetical protein
MTFQSSTGQNQVLEHCQATQSIKLWVSGEKAFGKQEMRHASSMISLQV